ncbi:hypothetical protein BCR43DRAFT_486037 [Syncephalastrum racemosum]|uniref:BZIP domain-containing protein n=1 Tax=Syncephalastrum racemosum TaxID=13706 RepID=A0A1X2HNF0_SYNRA|nr:hypothetical protein BCR43DRAFT_486037 [Syncephalastrum racemosum]
MTTTKQESYTLGPDLFSALYPLQPSSEDLARILSDTNQLMIDDWLAEDLHQSGFLKDNTNESFCIDASLLPSSPPLTASPTNTAQSSVSPVQSHAQIPPHLFPDVLALAGKQQPQLIPSPPQPAAQQQSPPNTPAVGAGLAAPGVMPRPLVPIMPKTSQSPLPRTLSPIPSRSQKRRASSQEQDEIALKRQRNTDAARRSRLKKLQKMETLENRVSELEGENSRLNTRVAVLESEKSGLESKDKDLQDRIRKLEEQLAEAHKALTAKCSH